MITIACNPLGQALIGAGITLGCVISGAIGARLAKTSPIPNKNPRPRDPKDPRQG